MIMTDVLLSVQTLLFMLQIHEWQSMVYIITTQKRRSLEQILYDHETEIVRDSLIGNMSKIFNKEQISYRNKEIVLRRIQRLSAVVVSILVLVFAILFLLNISFSIILFGFLYVFMLLFLSFNFFKLTYLMSKYHSFEYKRSKTSVNLSFVLMTAIICFYLWFSTFYFALHCNLYGCETMKNETVTFGEGCAKLETRNLTRVIAGLHILIYDTGTPSIIYAFVIVVLKRSDDILQGINKLDYLLKVSVFQKYKDSKLERGKFSIFTGDTLGPPIDPDLLTSSQLNQSIKISKLSYD
jgi:hypothetical protein